MISHIDSTLILTDNLPRLVKFYRDTLELAVLHENPRHVLLGHGSGAMIGLAQSQRIKGRTREPYRFMVSFFCEDVYGTAFELERRGVEFSEEPYDDGDATVATFTDPDGNILRIINYPVS
ncbi:MAG TPA: VOC family protein [Anaerolineae bacterium]